jgi:thioredoxin-related protein
MQNTILYIIAIILVMYALMPPKCRRSTGGRHHKQSRVKKTIIHWFYRPGCPHCDNMSNDWYALTNCRLPKKYKLVGVDTTLEKNKSLAEKYNVSGVPHITKTLPCGTVQIYNGTRTKNAMRQWILNS